MTNPTRDRWRQEGKCLECGTPASGYAYCERHREARREARRERSDYRYGKGERVRVFRWLDSPSGNPVDLGRMPKASVAGTVASPPTNGGEYYTVDFPAPYGRLQVLEAEMVRVE